MFNIKEDIILVCEALLKYHKELIRTNTSTTKIEECQCPECQAARRLIEEIYFQDYLDNDG